jgi:hypothetical protein
VCALVGRLQFIASVRLRLSSVVVAWQAGQTGQAVKRAQEVSRERGWGGEKVSARLRTPKLYLVKRSPPTKMLYSFVALPPQKITPSFNAAHYSLY